MEFKLIIKKINNTLSEEEAKVFDRWYSESHEHRAYYNRVRDSYLKGAGEVSILEGWAQVRPRIERKRKWTKYFEFAASIAILMATTSIWLLDMGNTHAHPKVQAIEAINNPIEVGTDKATLTLEDGSQIALQKGTTYETGQVSSNGESIVYQGGETSSKMVIAENLLTIPRGGQFFVVLADGTKVWMNSETQLRYPVTFLPGKNREVTLLYGEAYFEVSPSSEHGESRFVVHTVNQQVEVLGTQFNIKAYKGETDIATTLVEGKVIMTSGKDSQRLEPGQQSKLKRGNDVFAISTVDVYEETSWKNGIFTFNNKSLIDIMQVLSRWYDIRIKFQNDEIKGLTFNGVFRKSQSLENILIIIKNTNEVNYEINQKTITMK